MIYDIDTVEVQSVRVKDRVVKGLREEIIFNNDTVRRLLLSAAPASLVSMLADTEELSRTVWSGVMNKVWSGVMNSYQRVIVSPHTTHHPGE